MTLNHYLDIAQIADTSTMFCLLCHFWINARIVNIRAINTATAREAFSYLRCSCALVEENYWRTCFL